MCRFEYKLQRGCGSMNEKSIRLSELVTRLPITFQHAAPYTCNFFYHVHFYYVLQHSTENLTFL